jgi:hypothetical protein
LIHCVVDEAAKRCGLRPARVRPAAGERPTIQAARA